MEIRKKPEVTTAIILDTRRPKLDLTFPVKLRVTYNRTQKYYNTRFSFNETDYKKVTSTTARGDYKRIKKILEGIENSAIDIIDNELNEFSFQEFEKYFIKTKGDKKELDFLFKEKIESLKKEKRIGTAQSYDATLKSLKEFGNNRVLKIDDITPDFLKRYDQRMIKNEKSVTTIGIYLRNLRHIFNLAIENRAISQNSYPFGTEKDKSKYAIPSTVNKKKALTIEEIRKIIRYKTFNHKTENFARDLWLFSYLCNGMNIADIAYLKYKNVSGEELTFYRKKTFNYSKEKKLITVILLDLTKKIIKTWGNKPIEKENYIFPILKPEMSIEEQHSAIKQAVKTINKYIDRITSNIGIEHKITTYWARHSYSTVLKRSGVSHEFISEQLGHHSLNVTNNYLDSFEYETMKENANKLL